MPALTVTLSASSVLDTLLGASKESSPNTCNRPLQSRENQSKYSPPLALLPHTAGSAPKKGSHIDAGGGNR